MGLVRPLIPKNGTDVKAENPEKRDKRWNRPQKVRGASSVPEPFQSDIDGLAKEERAPVEVSATGKNSGLVTWGATVAIEEPRPEIFLEKIPAASVGTTMKGLDNRSARMATVYWDNVATSGTVR